MASRTQEIAGKKIKRKECWNTNKKEYMDTMLKSEHVLLLLSACNPSLSYNGRGYTNGVPHIRHNTGH
jgi:hypothetical protein